MISRINLTGLQKLHVGEAYVEVFPVQGKRWGWQLHHNLKTEDFTNDCTVHVDFKRGPYYHRQSLGPVSTLSEQDPEPLPLEFGDIEPPKFRIRISRDSGVLVKGYWKWRSSKLQEVPSTSFLPIIYREMEDGWRLKQDWEDPVLILNESLMQHRNSSWVRLLVIPAAVREIYLRMFLWCNSQEDVDFDSEDWIKTWVSFATDQLSLDHPSQVDGPDESGSYISDAQLEWIDQAQEEFCRKNGLLVKLLGEIGGTHDED